MQKYKDKKRKRFSLLMMLMSLSIFISGCAETQSATQELSNTKAQENTNKEDVTVTVEDTEATDGESTPDFAELGISPYEYNSDFELQTSLKEAIEELDLISKDFDVSTLDDETWKQTFIRAFLQNSRYSSSYQDGIVAKTDGVLSKEEAEYIQYSLTGKMISFDQEINTYDSSSGYTNATAGEYSIQQSGDTIKLTIEMDVQSDGSDNVTKEEVSVELTKNPYSCFDGYSIQKLSSKDVTPQIECDGKEHSFFGTAEIDDGDTIYFLYDSNEDDISYGMYVVADLSENEDLANYVRANPGKTFKISYILENITGTVVENVIPTSIVVSEN